MTKQKPKVIITGTGLLASTISQYKKNEWEMYFISRSNTPKPLFDRLVAVNLHHNKDIESCFKEISPDFVIHTSGLTNVDECERNYDQAYISNYQIALNVAQVCHQINCKLVHLSTDHFANQNLDCSAEDDLGIPLNIYAETKLIGEMAVARACPSTLILRTNFFGQGLGEKKSFSDFIINNLKEKRPITLFNDVYYTPVLMEELIDSMQELLNKSCSGTFNISSNQKITKHQFGIALAEILKLDSTLITKGTITRSLATKRPHNMALSNQKLVNTLGKSFDFNYKNSIKKLSL